MLAVHGYGSGERLVALHGFTYTGGQFAALAERIGRAIEAPDLPGHGRSAEVPTDFAFTIGAIARVIGSPAPLLGYSQGARLALAVALDRPDLVRGLVLISGTPGIRDAEARRTRVAIDAALAASIREMGIDAFLHAWTSRGITDTTHLPVDERDADLRVRSHASAHGLAAALEGFGQGMQPSLWDRLGQVTVPTLIVTGEEDTTYTAIGDEMRVTLPDAERCVIPDAGHNPMLDALDATAAAVSGFLLRLDGIEEG